MRQKTIWIVNQYAGSKSYGMEYRHYYLGEEFSKYGDDVYIFSSSYSHLFRKLPKIKGNFTFEKIENINYCWAKIPKYDKSKSAGRALSMVAFMIKLFKFRTEKIPKPDVIIVSSPSPFPILNAYFWERKFMSKIIFEVRDLWPLTLIELGNISKYHPFVMLMQWFEDFAYEKSNFVVSVLPKTKEYMISHGMKENKFIYIPNGIDLEEINKLEPLEEDILIKVPKDKFIVGYMGTIGIANALEYLIKAAEILKKFPDIHFIIVGEGGEKARLKETAKKLNNITFIQSIKKTQVQSMLKFFDICYIGLKKEKLFRFGVSPNKLFDYLYAGKPILYSIEAGNDPVKEASCGISVEAENPEAISKGIIKLYNNPEDERKKTGENGKKYVTENHSYEILAEKYRRLF